ncbi:MULTISPECIES: tetratricopeptide repeat protein [Actinosynnema]|uniref:tetratricopeptide repeat protein n=1 Tax=Actinosynnema TaxID=40566 RepID=UPI0020A44AA2|nr:tetratricopeptide repeat protein [Actinosynnema pretiosum]MCP2095064.1 Tetratricopeptide repeat-containing protein [Actinosynnema pretiosum]
MTISPLPPRVRAALALLALHTDLRRGIDRVAASGSGGLFVLGWDDTVDKVCSGGYPLPGVAATPENLSQTAKMDLAVILGGDGLTEIVRAHAVLRPHSNHVQPGHGARHSTAANTARDIAVPVVAVSEETGVATLYTGEHRIVLTERNVLMSKTAVRVLLLESRLSDLCDPALDLARADELRREVGALLDDLDLLLLELGDDGAITAELVVVYRRKLAAGPVRGNPLAPGETDEWWDHALVHVSALLSGTPDVTASADPSLPELRFRDEPHALAWLDKRWVALLRSTRWALDSGDHRTALRRLTLVLDYCYHRKPWRDWIDLATSAVLIARRIGDQATEAALLSTLGLAHRELRDHEVAVELLSLAAEVWRGLDDPSGCAVALNRLAYAHVEAGTPDLALSLAGQALELAVLAGDPKLEGMVLNNLCGMHRRAGDLVAALEHGDRATEAFQRAGYRQGLAWAEVMRGNVHHDAGRHQEAVACYQAALAVRTAVDDRYGVAVCHHDLARTLLASGDRAGAREHLDLALAHFDAIGDPRAGDVRELLREVAG